jgi:uncharacterized protein (DUF2225 family)
MNYACIVCRNCGYKIQTPFVCWCDAPVHFIVTCPKCGYRAVYSDTDLVVHNKEECEKSCKEAASISEKILTSMGISILIDAIMSVATNVIQALATEEQKEENKN